jgi:hypothetical protein
VQLKRVLFVLPVFAGLLLAGTAMARMLPAETVRDAVYQTCKHNGVHFNKQGHANCGLHKGWSEEGDDQSTEASGERHGHPQNGKQEQDGVKPAGHEKHAKHEKHVTHEKHGKPETDSGKAHGHGSGKGGGKSHGKQG